MADFISLDTPLLIRLLEWAREEAGDDVDLHVIAERMDRLSGSQSPVLTMSDYPAIVGDDHSEPTEPTRPVDGLKPLNPPPIREDQPRMGGKNSLLTGAMLEKAADGWWSRLTPTEKKIYIKAHPKSKYARPGSAFASDPLEKHGWERVGKTTWRHPKSRRKITFRRSDTHAHHLVVTHADGTISEHKSNSDRRVSRLVRRMAIPAGARIAKVLGEKPGSLHRYLGIEKGKPLPLGKLEKLAGSDHPLADRARLVLNLKRARKRGPIEYRAAR
jgi:hypothetical protein